MQFKDYWNETHQKYSQGKIVYDNWLDNYKSVLDKCKTPVLDLGCGTGNDTLYLTERGFRVIVAIILKLPLTKLKTLLLMLKLNLLTFLNHFLLMTILLI